MNVLLKFLSILFLLIACNSNEIPDANVDDQPKINYDGVYNIPPPSGPGTGVCQVDLIVFNGKLIAEETCGGHDEFGHTESSERLFEIDFKTENKYRVSQLMNTSSGSSFGCDYFEFKDQKLFLYDSDLNIVKDWFCTYGKAEALKDLSYEKSECECIFYKTTDEVPETYITSNEEIQSPVEAPKELWNRVNLIMPASYNLENSKAFEYSSAPKYNEDDVDTWGYNVRGFYPIGWSVEGQLFAFLNQGAGLGYSKIIELLNVKTGQIERSMLLEEFNMDMEESIKYHNLYDKEVEDFLRKHKICKHFDYQKGNSFKSSINGNYFNFELKTDKQIFLNDELTFNSGLIEIFANMISPESKAKKIISYEHLGGLLNLEIHGFIKSPVENKVILLISSSEKGFENETDISYRLVSCDLNTDSFEDIDYEISAE